MSKIDDTKMDSKEVRFKQDVTAIKDSQDPAKTSTDKIPLQQGKKVMR